MHQRFIWVAVLFTLLSCGVASAQQQPSDLGSVVDKAEPRTPAPPAGDEIPKLSPADEILASLSVEQKVAQLMLVTLSGLYRPNEEDRRILKEFPPGGLIIPHVTTPSDAAIYIAELRESAIESELKTPFLIGTSGIGDLLSDAPPAQSFFDFPQPLTLTAADRANPAKSLGALVAEFMSTMGFNFHLGPALSLAPNHRDIDPRSDHFGSDPEFVARFGATFLDVLKEQNLVWIPMGFPGGSANRNGESPAVLTVPRSELAKLDLLPYTHLVDAGAEILHVGNTLVPTLDSSNVPASLSHKVIDETLRNLLGFRGIVVAGPLDTRDITVARNPAEAALMSLQAGADMLYWTRSRGDVILALGSLAQAVYKGRIDERFLDEKVRRILQFKLDHNLLERNLPEKKKNRKLGEDERRAAASMQIERAAVTLIKNDGNLLPLTKENALPLGITGVVGTDELHDALEEYIKPIAMQRITTARHIGRIQDFEIDRLTRRGRGMRIAICVFSDTVDVTGQVRLIRKLQSLSTKVVVVIVGPPTHLEHVDIADAVVLAYADADDLGRSMIAIADVIAGKGPLDLIPPSRDVRGRIGQEFSFDVLDVVRTPVGRLPISLGQYAAGYSIAYSPELAIRRVRWNFGDGDSSMQNRTTHTFSEAGTYPVTLTVVDEQKNERSQVYHVVVE